MISRDFSDVNECNNPSLFSCPDRTKCVNLPGTYSCACAKGYESTVKGKTKGMNIKCKGKQWREGAVQ